MTISRKLHEIRLTFDRQGSPTVRLTGIIADTEEGTHTGAVKIMQAPAVLSAAAALRDACRAVAANAGKPLEF